MTQEDKKQEEEGRRARRSWREVPMSLLAFMLLGVTVLNFAVDLAHLAFEFSTGKLADALIRLVVGVAISCALLWIFARLKSRKRTGRPPR